MATKRMNVLVYSGNGCTVEAVRHCVYSLRRLLSPNYAVISVDGNSIIKEPWTASCALLVFPGGADLGYCRTLNGEGNRKISQYVERGGSYMGFCAGAYYGSKRCEFEEGNKMLEVVGERELAFYPGTCRGLAFPGFVYHSEEGARAVELKVSKTGLSKGALPDVFRSYYNGGGVFVDAPKFQEKGVEILASYTQKLEVDSGEGTAAVVYCKVGDGTAVLTAPHPEFAAVNLDQESKIGGYDKVVEDLAEDDKQRTDFLKACLLKLGLKVSRETSAVPSLSRLHLSSMLPNGISNIMAGLQEIVSIVDGEEYIKDENDTFHLEKPSAWSLGSLAKTLTGGTSEKTEDNVDDEDRIIDYNAVVKRLVVHQNGLPPSKETPYFNHDAFYANLRHYKSQIRESTDGFGSNVLYGEVVTSTNTLLEKNTEILRRLPAGFTATATVQVAGRGRGSNVWVSPAGSLMFSTVVRHPVSLTSHAPVVFLQYLAALAIVEGIKTYDVGYKDMQVKLKWPNDIYAVDPSSKDLVKIGGILVNSHYDSSEFLSVVGIGLNTTNAAPTISLNALKPPSPFTLEKLLARILTTFSALYSKFVQTGFDKSFEQMYYKYWLHTDQIVTLEAEGGVRARIKGITRDWGLLLVEELGWEDRATGKIWTLQSDSNSFDFFKGLVKRSTTAVETLPTTQPIEASKKKKSLTRSKPKNYSKCKMELRSRRVIEKAGPDLNKTAAIATANSLMPLLSLPQEIKNRIYELVLSGNLLHIERNLVEYKRGVIHSTKGGIKELRFTHHICCSQISEEVAQRYFDAEDGSSLYVKDTELRHSNCGPSEHNRSAAITSGLDISLLHVCRQIYNEARFIPYSTNTFSFDTPRTLRAFIHLLIQPGVNVNAAFRSLHIDLAHINHDLHGWAKAFSAVTQHMTLLETVYINVDQKPGWSRSADAQQKEIAMQPVLECLAILGKTPAKCTMIVVSDRFVSKRSAAYLMWAPNDWITHRWTVEDKRRWVEKVKLAIQDKQLFGSGQESDGKGQVE